MINCCQNTIVQLFIINIHWTIDCFLCLFFCHFRFEFEHMQFVVTVLCMGLIDWITMYNSIYKTKDDFLHQTQVHEYLRSKLCSLYENDCIFDKFECVWNSSDR